MNICRALALLGLMAWLGQPAFADPASPQPAAPSSAVQPWSAGVSEAAKAQANQLLVRGNELLVQNRYAAALEQYELAIRAWDHPAIRANMVICYINLARPVEAYESALLALKYGPDPHDKPDAYNATLNYRKLLEGQIATLDVRCTESGARLSLDGQDLIVCPDHATRYVVAGRHQLVARKLGFLTVTRDIDAVGGHKTSMDVELVRLADAARTERPWKTWKPWAIAGSGVGIFLVGGLVQLLAQSDMDRYDSGLVGMCGAETGGCAPNEIPDSLSDLKSRAELENGIAIGTMITGGAVVVTGVVGVLLNRPRTVLPVESGFGFRIAPMATPAATGVAFGGTF